MNQHLIDLLDRYATAHRDVGRIGMPGRHAATILAGELRTELEREIDRVTCALAPEGQAEPRRDSWKIAQLAATLSRSAGKPWEELSNTNLSELIERAAYLLALAEAFTGEAAPPPGVRVSPLADALRKSADV
jgi:hypothetical protein